MLSWFRVQGNDLGPPERNIAMYSWVVLKRLPTLFMKRRPYTTIGESINDPRPPSTLYIPYIPTIRDNVLLF